MLVDLMRKNQRWLMFVISILVIISFVYMYSRRGTSMDRYGEGGEALGKIYNRNVTRPDVDRIQREFQTAAELGLSGFNRTFGNDPDSLWDLYVVRHEAERLGILPTDSEIQEAIMKLPFFQAEGNAGFDPARYQQYVTEKLSSRGLLPRDLEDLVRVDLQLTRLHELIGSTVTVSPSEVRSVYDMIFTKVETAVVRLKSADLLSNIAVTDADVRKYYDEHKDHLQDPERRVVQYVLLDLTPEQKKLPARERTEAAQKLSDKTDQFTQKMTDPNADFMKTAADFQLPVKETPEFSQMDAANQLKGDYLSPDLLADFVASAFHLNQKDPNSDALPGPENQSFYILHLAKIIPSRPLSLDEAKAKIVESIKNSRAQESLVAKAEEYRKQISASLAAGKSIADAAKAAGLTEQDIPPYSLDDRQKGAEPRPPDADVIMDKADQLNVGELSPFLPTPDGGVFVYLKKREPVDAAKFAQMETFFSMRVNMKKENDAFNEWLRANREAAGLQVVGGARASG